MKKTLLIIGLIMLALFVPVVTADSLDTYCATSPLGRDACIKQIAIQRNDLSLCDKISTQSGKNSCFLHFAKHLNNMDLCRGIIKGDRGTERELEKKYDCYIHFVKSFDDLHICEQYVKKDRYHDECLDEILDEDRTRITLCDLYAKESKKIRCIKKVAKALDNLALCDKILEGHEPIKCQFKSSKVCNRDDEIDYEDEVDACRVSIEGEEIAVIKDRCKDYDQTIRLNLHVGEKKEIFFPDDHHRLDRFFITHKWHDRATGYVTFEIFTGIEREAFGGLAEGKVVTFEPEYLDKMGIQVLKTGSFEREKSNKQTETIHTVDLCLYKVNSKKKPSTSSSSDSNDNDDDESNDDDDDKEEKKKGSSLDPRIQAMIDSFGGEDAMTLEQWAEVRELKNQIRLEKAEQKRAEASEEDEDKEETDNEDTEEETTEDNAEQDTGAGKKQVKVKEKSVVGSIIKFFKWIFGG